MTISNINLLSRSLEAFYPDLKNYYMCPVCFKKISLKDDPQISEAHIIPKSASGKLKTYLCRKCNSFFGSKQDKWFGELLRIENTEDPSILSTIIKNRYFTIDGIRVNGYWKKDSKNNFEFYIYSDRNSPHALKLFREHFKTHKHKLNLSFPLPILKNQKLIDVGFLTAGYLMWFRALGYSWALQKHLQPVRDQILNPDKELITANYVFTGNVATPKPWFGIIKIDNTYFPSFSVGRYIVVFPPRYNPNIYDSLTSAKRDINISDVKPFSFSGESFYSPPSFLLYEKYLLMAPDLPPTLMNTMIGVLFTRDSPTAKILRPVNHDEFERQKKLTRTVSVNIKLET